LHASSEGFATGSMSKLVLATSNRGKLAELQPMLADAGFSLVTQGELGVGDAIEDGRTFIENALIKARHACVATGLPALGDDSGLVVDALGGAPGLYSARYAGEHGNAGANIAKLLHEMRDLQGNQRRAFFYCVIVLLRHADDPRPLVAEGVWHGHVLPAPDGDGGFGYDPVFFDPRHGASAARIDPALKNRISHRGLALARLREQLQPGPC
jgi:XTP/dITP diphosphohydrolase